jgi:diacylglycerol kinase family enzyme
LKKITVIYNPVAGGKKRPSPKAVFEKYLCRHELSFFISESASHLKLLSQQVSESDVDIVMVAGGDGTVNMVGRALAGTNKCMYIVPLGSGNGLARHFKYPIQLDRNLQCFSPDHKVLTIKTGKVAGEVFLNISGLGFDALVSKQFSIGSDRGLWGYVKAVVRKLNYRPSTYTLYSESKEVWKGKAFLINVANASQWGNDFVVAPFADPLSSCFDVVVLKPFSVFSIPIIVYKLLRGEIHQSSYFQSYKMESGYIELEQKEYYHIDGEPGIPMDTIEFKAGKDLRLLLPTTIY